VGFQFNLLPSYSKAEQGSVATHSECNGILVIA